MPKQKAYSTLATFLPQPAFAMAKKSAPKNLSHSTRAAVQPATTQHQSRVTVVTEKEREPEMVSALSSHASTYATLTEVQTALAGCTRCKLCEQRKTIVFGEGNPHPELMFVGEGPGEHEDIQGRPFVGPAGQLLTKMIEAMKVKREDVFIANVVKCRPPNNRVPEPDEVSQCQPFLEAQIRLLKPKVIVALGGTAAKNLLKTEESIGKLRGKIHSYQGTKLIATFHPSYLLRNPSAKKDCWADLQVAMKELGWK